MNSETIVTFLIGAFSGALMAAVITHGEMNKSWKADAAAVGHAEFFMDEKNTRQWRWKGQEK